ncbi:MAG TPA: deoxyribodipyrimidine photo-lyase, partial [Burkholderiaceae bacterium]|nr:deoxyribodipyrimidine photo-lyase [Burkholderiaceae bacterium]
MQHSRGLVWFRRDLRLTDNAALTAALSRCQQVYCAFIFDRTILDELLAAGITHDRRVDFIHRSIVALDASLRARGSSLIVRHADA